MQALEPAADLHDPVVSSRWVTRRKIRLIESIDACVGSPPSLEGIVLKRRSGCSPDWRARTQRAEAVRREAEEDWGR